MSEVEHQTILTVKLNGEQAVGMAEEPEELLQLVVPMVMDGLRQNSGQHVVVAVLLIYVCLEQTILTEF